MKNKGRLTSPPLLVGFALLRGKLFSLTFMPHEFESTLGLFVSRRDFFLHLSGELFHLWREAHVAVVLHAGPSRNQAADDDVFLQAAQVIDSPLNGSFGQHTRRLLEGGGRDERLGRERSLRDAEQQRT